MVLHVRRRDIVHICDLSVCGLDSFQFLEMEQDDHDLDESEGELRNTGLNNPS